MGTAQFMDGRTDYTVMLNVNYFFLIEWGISHFSTISLKQIFVCTHGKNTSVHETYFSYWCQIQKRFYPSPTQTFNLLGKDVMIVEMGNYSHWTFLLRKQYYLALFLQHMQMYLSVVFIMNPSKTVFLVPVTMLDGNSLYPTGAKKQHRWNP